MAPILIHCKYKANTYLRSLVVLYSLGIGLFPVADSVVFLGNCSPALSNLLAVGKTQVLRLNIKADVLVVGSFLTNWVQCFGLHVAEQTFDRGDSIRSIGGL